MKKFLLLSSVLLLFIGCGKKTLTDNSKVYICNGRYSKCYHSTRHCEGLDNCSTEIETITLKEAKAKHRRPCGYCCNN